MFLVFRPRDSVHCTAAPGCLDFHSQRFSSCSRNDASLFRDRQAQRLSGANHGSIRGSWPMAFSGCPRGPRVVCETGCPRHAAPNFTVETHSRTRASQEPTGHHQGKSRTMERIPETLKLFVVSDVRRRTKLLSSKRSTRSLQSCAPASGAPFPASFLWPPERCKTPATARVWWRR